MKKILFLLLLSFSTLSFAQNDLTIEKYTLKLEDKQKFEEQLVYNLRMAEPKDFGNGIFIKDSEIVRINKHLYLRTYFNNGFVSTTNLKYTSDSENKRYKYLMPAGTSCTSKACASGGGCIPKFLSPYCEPCNKGNGDCIRTSSNMAKD